MLWLFSVFIHNAKQLEEFIAFMKGKEPQSIHSSMEKGTDERKREDTESEKTRVEGKKCHA